MRTGSILEPLITEYVAFHHALGKGFEGEHYILRAFNRWVMHTGVPDLTAETFTAWCRTQQHLVSGVRRRHMAIVRNFCLYRHRRDPHCFVPDLLLFPAPHQPRPPYIFSQADISCLLHVADGLAPTPVSPLRAQVYRLAIVLLYTTGLRRGELVRLTLGDYAPHERTLLVRQSKFHKSTLSPPVRRYSGRDERLPRRAPAASPPDLPTDPLDMAPPSHRQSVHRGRAWPGAATPVSAC
jgi:integrase